MATAMLHTTEVKFLMLILTAYMKTKQKQYFEYKLRNSKECFSDTTKVKILCWHKQPTRNKTQKRYRYRPFGWGFYEKIIQTSVKHNDSHIQFCTQPQIQLRIILVRVNIPHFIIPQPSTIDMRWLASWLTRTRYDSILRKDANGRQNGKGASPRGGVPIEPKQPRRRPCPSALVKSEGRRGAGFGRVYLSDGGVGWGAERRAQPPRFASAWCGQRG